MGRLFDSALLDKGIGDLEHAFVAPCALPVGAEGAIDDKRRNTPCLIGLRAALRLVDSTANPKGLKGLEKVLFRGAGRSRYRRFINLIGKEASNGFLASRGFRSR